jgi:hypothetical protein
MIAAVTFMVTSNNAQNTADTRDKVQFGFKVGANLSNVYDSKGEEFNADPKFGLATGTFLTIPIGKFLGVQPELLFSQKGFQATGRFLGNPYKFTRTTNYIDMPLLFALKPCNEITLLAGPQYSYLMKQRDVFTDSNTSDAQEKEFKNDNIRKNMLCFLGGIDINMTNVIIGGRVGWDIQNNNGDGTSSAPRYKNVWYQLTIGFKFL